MALISFVLGLFLFNILRLNSATLVGFLGVIIGTLITSIVNYYNSKRERENKLNLIAYERIVDAHQQAYAKWFKVKQNIYSDRDILNKAYFEMQNWLAENCLYLYPEIEHALRVSINCATSHKEFVRAPRDNELILRNWETIHKPEELIRQRIKLHPIPIPDDPGLQDSNT